MHVYRYIYIYMYMHTYIRTQFTSIVDAQPYALHRTESYRSFRLLESSNRQCRDETPLILKEHPESWARGALGHGRMLVTETPG